MGKFRRFLSRLVKPAAFAAAAMFMSLSLVVTMPGTAQAWDPDVIKAPPRITAGVKDAISGVVSGVKTINPEVWRTAGTAATTAGKFGFRFLGGWLSVAMLAYDTKDTWMPWVADAFGQATGTGGNFPAATGPNVATPMPGLTINSLSQVANGINIKLQYSGTSTAFYADATFTLYCKRPDNTTYSTTYGFTGNLMSGNGSYPNNKSTATYCQNSTHTLTGAVGGPFGGDPRLNTKPSGANYGPTNVVEFGNQLNQGAAAFNPLDPLTKYKVRSECVDNAGNKSWIEAETAGDQGALKVPACGAAIPGAHGTGGVQVTGLKPGGNPGTDTKTLWDTSTAPLSDPATPLCDPGRAGAGCELMVTKDGQPCTQGDTECENWQENSQKDDATKARYGCKFGPYVVPLTVCNMLAKAYFPGGAPGTDENTDGDPKTNNDKGATGQPIPAPAPAVTGTVPGAAGAPTPGTTTDPEALKARQCFPQGWAMFNPVEWVLKPIRCAFEPSKSLNTRVTGMQAQFANRVPMSWFGGAIGNVGSGQCPADWKIEFQGTQYPFICGTQADSILHGFRPVFGGMLVVAFLWPLIRSLWYSAIPIFKVNPS